MKTLVSLVLMACIVPMYAAAQPKDSLRLLCPLTGAQEPPAEKHPYSLGAEQPKLLLTSATDTVAKACTSGTVTTIMRDADGRWEIMFNNKDYYFDYAGLTTVKVVRGQKLKPGDPIGIVRPGDNIELMIYDFETPLDPKSVLACFP